MKVQRNTLHMLAAVAGGATIALSAAAADLRQTEQRVKRVDRKALQAQVEKLTGGSAAATAATQGVVDVRKPACPTLPEHLIKQQASGTAAAQSTAKPIAEIVDECPKCGRG